LKILHTVEQYYPSLGGMQEVVRQLSERLVNLGHDVTVATSHRADRMDDMINGVRIASFQIEGNVARGMKGEIDSYRTFLLHSNFDIVTNFAAQQWATDIALPILFKIRGKKVFVPTGFSGFYLPEYIEYFMMMKSWMKAYDMNVFLSDDYRDIKFAREIGIKNIVVIPNGAAEDEFSKNLFIDIRKKLNILEEMFLILHVGSYSGIKGHHEALEIFYRANIKNAVLLFIGNNNELFQKQLPSFYKLKLFLLAKNKKIIITYQLTREETLAAYHTADLFLFPSNIECSPIVLFESMASKTPFLTTDVGNSKEIIEWSGGGLLLPTKIDSNGYSHPEIVSSAKLLEQLYFNQDKREALSSSGYGSWKGHFTWEKITRQYENIYQDLLA
jgi:L-malate glycosyltransferase